MILFENLLNASGTDTNQPPKILLKAFREPDASLISLTSGTQKSFLICQSRPTLPQPCRLPAREATIFMIWKTFKKSSIFETTPDVSLNQKQLEAAYRQVSKKGIFEQVQYKLLCVFIHITISTRPKSLPGVVLHSTEDWDRLN